MNEEAVTKSYTLYPTHIAIVEAFARERGYPGASSALRRIIDEWAQDKHDAERELPMAQEAK